MDPSDVDYFDACDTCGNLTHGFNRYCDACSAQLAAVVISKTVRETNIAAAMLGVTRNTSGREIIERLTKALSK